MRTDLLQLTAAALAQLANVGLLKRAQRELAGDYRPVLLELPDGTVQASFPDGVRTELGPAAGLREARCSCAAALCRHRLALVLAYQQQAASAAQATPPLADPATLDDAGLQAACGERAMAAARRLRATGLVVEVQRPAAGQGPPCARLPTATVLFHGGADLALARCDCQAAERCVHVVLAAWAFRAAAEPLPRQRVELGDAASAIPALPLSALASATRAVLDGLLEHGLLHGVARHGPALQALRSAAGQADATWVLLALEELERWLLRHERRSARFAPGDGVLLLAELEARCRAGRGAGALSAASVLGSGELLEAELGRIRLLAIGTRIHADGDRREAAVVLLDPDTGTVLELRGQWQQPDTFAAAEALALARRTRLAPAVHLGALGSGQLVSTNARRRADGVLQLGASHGGRLSLTAQTGRWHELPGVPVCRDLGAWLAARRQLPPALLRARRGHVDYLVVELAQVDALFYDAGQQLLCASARDPAGTPLRLLRAYERAAPGALDALAARLAPGLPPVAPLLVAGPLRRGGSGLELEPWAIGGAHFVVPDLAAADGSLGQVELGTAATRDSAHGAGLAELHELLAEFLLHGAGARPQLLARAAELARRLAGLGLALTAAGLRRLAAEGLADPAPAWTELALRLALLLES